MPIALFAVAAPSDPPWWLFGLSALILCAMWAGVVAAHEAAHALTAELLGCRVAEVSLGRGSARFYGRVADVRIVVRRNPLGGHTLSMPTDERRRMVIVAAGPAMDLVLACTGFALGGPFSRGFGVLAGITFISNIVPFGKPSGPGTDGFRLLHLLRDPPASEELRANVRAALEAEAALERGDAFAAAAWLDHGSRGEPNDRMLRVIDPIVRIAMFDARGGRDRALIALADPDLQGVVQPILLNALARANLLLDDPRLVPEAVRVSAEALAADRRSRAIQGTAGWALIEAGRTAEGVALVRRSMRGWIAGRDRAVTRCTLAIGLARLGRLNGAETQLRAAAARQEGSDVFLRARREVDAAWALVGELQLADASA